MTDATQDDEVSADDQEKLAIGQLIGKLQAAASGEAIEPAFFGLACEAMTDLRVRLHEAETRLQHLSDPSKARLVSFENGMFTFSAPIVRLMTEYLAQMLIVTGAETPSNYTETEVFHDKLGALTLTLQRRSGKTPHQFRMEAEAERDALRAEVAQLRAELMQA